MHPEFQFTYFIHQYLANINQELIIAVCNKSCSNFFFDLSAEFFFSLHNALTECLIEHFLSQFARNKTSDFFYLKAKVRLNILSDFLVDFNKEPNSAA